MRGGTSKVEIFENLVQFGAFCWSLGLIAQVFDTSCSWHEGGADVFLDWRTSYGWTLTRAWLKLGET